MKPKQKMKTPEGVEIALFPDEYLHVTQVPGGEYSHKGKSATDFGGKSGKFIAPHKLKVVKNDDPKYHAVYFHTVDEVWISKDGGKKSHLTYRLLHDNDVSNLKIGDIIEQGDPWYQEGGFGPKGPKTYGTHIHVEIGIGHSLKANKAGLPNPIDPDDVWFINDTIVNNDGGMKWKKYVAPIIPDPIQDPAPDPITPEIKVGSKVRVIGTHYATGQKIPEWVKKRTFTVSRVRPGINPKIMEKALLREITSWVLIKDLKLV